MRVRWLTPVLVATISLAAAGSASAQQLMGTGPGYQGLPVRPYVPAETGVAISDGVYLHGGVGTEMGYDSNVFYSASSSSGGQGPISSAILRVVPFVEINNQVRGSAVPTGLFFDLAANLQYRHYFTDDQAVDQSEIRNSFSPTVSALLDFSQAQKLGLSLADTFTRSEEAPYFASFGPLIRDSNLFSVQGRYSPGGGRIQGLLRYTNRLDIYEATTSMSVPGLPPPPGGGVTNYSYGNAMTHEGMLDLSWRWFPKTAVFFNGQTAFVQYLNTNNSQMITKSDSIQLRLNVGLRGLVTERTIISIALGYANAFYDNGTDPTGLGLLSARVDGVYRPTPITALSLGYQHDFQNSIIGNFYNLDGVNASVRQLIATRISASALGRYEHRNFVGTDPTNPTGSRTDNFAQVGVAADYYLKQWAYLGFGYNLFFNDSNAVLTGGVGTTPTSANYLKQQVFARLGFTY